LTENRPCDKLALLAMRQIEVSRGGEATK